MRLRFWRKPKPTAIIFSRPIAEKDQFPGINTVLVWTEGDLQWVAHRNPYPRTFPIPADVPEKMLVWLRAWGFDL